jgi:cytochrome c oxidase cbb3-type subunit III
MYKEILRGIAGIGVFPVISLLLFVAVFTIMLVRVLAMDRAGVQYLAGLPLDDGRDEAGLPREVPR